MPFPIVTEHSESRYLTGADFDPESIQPVGEHYWIGDGFGPWLIEVDADGVVLQVIATNPGGVDYKSPDNQFVSTPAAGAVPTGVNTGRSGGYEGMAQSMDGSTLYPLLEKPFYDEEAKALEADQWQAGPARSGIRRRQRQLERQGSLLSARRRHPRYRRFQHHRRHPR
ncbi:esterase-like activity of phytase family protein [Devosia sp. A8/3-2]|nr:esterase-like activity of phytase family protein [Devosia sp. A8/3-2]